MHRFFVKDVSPEQSEILIQGEDAFHINNVLRLKHNDEVVVCDGGAADYFCVINQLGKNEIILRVAEVKENQSEKGIKITLFQGLPKSDKMELVIQKCVELGVHRIIPVQTEFSVSRPDSNKKASKAHRWSKISESAAKQSQRGIIPEILEIVSLEESIGIAQALSGCFAAHEKENDRTLKACLKSFRGDSIGIYIGPEGGFSQKEIALLNQNNIFGITLGKRILRTETAGLAVVSIINYELEDRTYEGDL